MNENVKQPEAAAGFCRQCGKTLTPETRRDIRGVYYCEDCLAATALPGQATAAGGPNPVVAALLGLIPGVGAIYNGDYMKALVYIFIFGGTISIMESGAARGIEPLLGMFMAGFYFYMPIEAYQTAKRRSEGQAPSGSGWELGLGNGGRATPIGPVILIVLGVVFLLNTMDILPYGFRFWRFWPVILIGLGGWLLWKRTAGGPPAT